MCYRTLLGHYIDDDTDRFSSVLDKEVHTMPQQPIWHLSGLRYICDLNDRKQLQEIILLVITEYYISIQ